jgi:hypothetical protein
MITLLSLLLSVNAAAATSTIHATIRGTDRPLIVSLLQRDRDLDKDWHEITQRRMPASQREVDFDGLLPGVYQVRVQRYGSYEQAGTKVILGEGERRRTEIDIDPVEIVGRVLLAGAPLGKAMVKVKHSELQWQITFATSDDGKFAVRLWQRGSFEYIVRSPALGTPYHHFVTLKGGPPIRWDLRLPDRRIVGVVRDQVSGAPVAGAMLRVNLAMGNMTHHSRAKAGADGRFNLVGMEPGVVTVDASSDGYLDGTSAPLMLTETDHQRELVLTLEPGSAVPVSFRDATGRPARDVAVLTVVDGVTCGRASTDSDGSVRVTLPRSRTATIYAVPRDGSFAAIHVAKAEQAPARVTLPRSESSLHIVTHTTDGKPLANVGLLMRANGELIPPVVALELEERQGLSLHTDERGEALLRKLPVGSYEFWLYSDKSEAEEIVEAADSLQAPITVDVRKGENSVAVNLRAR